jgi:hypothetical protein
MIPSLLAMSFVSLVWLPTYGTAPAHSEIPLRPFRLNRYRFLNLVDQVEEVFGHEQRAPGFRGIFRRFIKALHRGFEPNNR